MYFFNEFTNSILRKYRNWLELPDSVPIGFTGVAGEVPAPVVSNEVDTDSLIFGFSINITVAQANDALIRIKSTSPQYNWMANVQAAQQDTPIGAICGLPSQVLPVLPLVMPFFLQANGKLEMRFTNSTASPITGGIITLRRLKLVLPIDGGFNPGF